MLRAHSQKGQIPFCKHANASLEDAPPWSAGRGAERADLCAALPGIGRAFSGGLVHTGNRDTDAGRRGAGAARVAVVTGGWLP